MMYQVNCTRCPAVLVDVVDRLRDDEIVATQEHCRREHGVDLTTMPIRDLVALVQIDVDLNYAGSAGSIARSHQPPAPQL
jgi:hypothetical protein